MRDNVHQDIAIPGQETRNYVEPRVAGRLVCHITGVSKDLINVLPLNTETQIDGADGTRIVAASRCDVVVHRNPSGTLVICSVWMQWRMSYSMCQCRCQSYSSRCEPLPRGSNNAVCLAERREICTLWGHALLRQHEKLSTSDCLQIL